MLAQKLKIKQGITLLTIHAPEDFAEQLSPLPENVSVVEKADDYNQIHWFVKNRIQLDREVNKIMKLLKESVVCWCYYPKETSKMQTDLTRDKGWTSLLEKEIQWLSLISFDDTWSAFAFRLKTDADRKKDEKPKVSEISKYIDNVNKTMSLPEDLEKAFKKHKKESDIFYQLSFSNRKEYVEWIVNARKEETRKQRVEATIERLAQGWKNPANR